MNYRFRTLQVILSLHIKAKKLQVADQEMKSIPEVTGLS
jgi:hypothetical protein